AMTLIYAEPLLQPEALAKAAEALPANANRQKQVLNFFAKQPAAVPLKTLLSHCNTTSSTVKSLEKKGYLRLFEQEQMRDPYAGRAFDKNNPLPLMPVQQKAFNALQALIH